MDLHRIRRPARSSNERVLNIEAGQVMCPRLGNIDIEDCWTCPAFGGSGGASDVELVCSGRVGPGLVLPFAVWPANALADQSAG